MIIAEKSLMLGNMILSALTTGDITIFQIRNLLDPTDSLVLKLPVELRNVPPSPEQVRSVSNFMETVNLFLCPQDAFDLYDVKVTLKVTTANGEKIEFDQNRIVDPSTLVTNPFDLGDDQRVAISFVPDAPNSCILKVRFIAYPGEMYPSQEIVISGITRRGLYKQNVYVIATDGDIVGTDYSLWSWHMETVKPEGSES